MGQSFVIICLVLVKCFNTVLLSSGQEVEVHLTGGRTPFEGRVEVRRNGENTWRYVCGTYATGWDLSAARAVCKQLGYVTVMWEWSNSEFGRSDLQSSVCDVRCNPLSESLEDCTIDWDDHGRKCQCNNHAGITCYYPGFLGRYKVGSSLCGTRALTLSWLYNVTIQGCIQECRDREETIAATRFGFKCYCGDDSVDYGIYGEVIPVLQTDRFLYGLPYTKQCSGDLGTSPFIQGCGGFLEIDVYNTSFGACGGDYTDSSGYIYSPNFPGNYTNEQSCTWTITVDPGHIVKLTTLMLRLQDNDMVIVKDGIEDHSSTISTFTGYSLPQPLNSSSNTLRIDMITNNAANDLGFVLLYETHVRVLTTPSLPVRCKILVTEVTMRKTTSQTPTPKDTTMQQEISCQCPTKTYQSRDGSKPIAFGFTIGVIVSLAVTAVTTIVVKTAFQRRRTTKRDREVEDTAMDENTDIDTSYTSLQLNEIVQSKYESLNSTQEDSTIGENAADTIEELVVSPYQVVPLK